MKMLIAINNMGCGGAQKSLKSLLSLLKKDQYSLDLLVLSEKDIFFDDFPEWISRVRPSSEVSAFFLPINDLMKSTLPVSVKLKGILAKSAMKRNANPEWNEVQNIWHFWKKYIPSLPVHYDLAVSYVDGFSNYFVMEKVTADRKILWVHNEYEKLSYNAEYDRPYFKKADALVTISDLCVESLNRIFPEDKDKTFMLHNLSSAEMIRTMAGDTAPEEYSGSEYKFISIGRLSEQKGFDLAVETAAVMRDRNFEFTWFIIGEGELESALRQQIEEKKLTEQVRLLGLRKNPYPYIKYADVFVQPSRYEGKSIVLDEAMVLQKPIVTTNYTTVYDSIMDGRNGSIAEFDAVKLADKIMKLASNRNLQNKYRQALAGKQAGDALEIKGYLELFEGTPPNTGLNGRKPSDDGSRGVEDES